MSAESQSTLAWARNLLLIKDFRHILTADRYKRFIRSLWFAVVLGIIEGVGIFAVIPAITAYSNGGTSMGLTWPQWILVLIVLAIAGAVITYAQQTTGYMAAMDLLRHCTINVGNKVARLPLGWFDRTVSSRLSILLTQSLMQIGEGAAHFLGPLVRGLTTMIVMTVLAWFWAWQLGLVFLIAIPVILLLTTATRALKRAGERMTIPTEIDFASRVVEFAHTQPSLRASGRAQSYEPLDRARSDNYRSHAKDLWVSLAGNVISGIGAQAITVALIIVAVVLGTSGTLTPIATVAFIGVSLRFSKILEEIVGNTLAIEVARQPIGQVEEIMSAPELPTPAERVSLPEPGTVAMKSATFGYHSDNPVIHDVSFSAPEHGLTAIVGPSGSGKTTLFRLIARFWDVDSGSVSVGGVDVKDQPTEQLMEQIAMVFQDVYLYDTTLYDNIKVGNDDATDDDVYNAGALAGVHEIAERLPGGWHSTVGEGGNRLSGGERQRVSIARALLKRAPIVLFDEATSALDPDNEAHIEQAINDLRDRSTVLVIAHKLNTIRNADKIVVLDENGSVVQVGTHDELIASSGMYQHLWSAREAAQGWSLI